MKKKAELLVEVTIDITCDACEASVVPNFQKENLSCLDGFQEFGVLRASYGYGSSHDGDNFNYDLCESCFEKLVGTVKALRASNGLDSN